MTAPERTFWHFSGSLKYGPFWWSWPYFTSRVWARFPYRVIPSISQGGSKCPPSAVILYTPSHSLCIHLIRYAYFLSCVSFEEQDQNPSADDLQRLTIHSYICWSNQGRCSCRGTWMYMCCRCWNIKADLTPSSTDYNIFYTDAPFVWSSVWSVIDIS